RDTVDELPTPAGPPNTDSGRRMRSTTDVQPVEGEATVLDDGWNLARALGQPLPGQPGGPDGAAPGPLSMLAGLSQPAIEAIASGMGRFTVRSGELIVREGDAGES